MLLGCLAAPRPEVLDQVGKIVGPSDHYPDRINRSQQVNIRHRNRLGRERQRHLIPGPQSPTAPNLEATVNWIKPPHAPRSTTAQKGAPLL